MSTETAIPSVELFVGAGGLGIAASRAGFAPKVVIDWDKWACDTIRENKQRGLAPFLHWDVVQGDIREYDFGQVEGPVDFVSGGPPCQPFSIGGQHRAYDDTRDMFPQAVRAVRTLRPRAFVFENVKGLTREAFRSYFEYVRLQLRHPEIVIKAGEGWEDHLGRLEDHEVSGSTDGLHYNVVARVLNAANYGVPQKRERVFIVGFRSDLGAEWHFPKETHSRDSLLWEKWRARSTYWDRHRIAKKDIPEDDRGRAVAAKLKKKDRRAAWATVRDAIADLPDPRESAGKLTGHRFVDGARSYPGHDGSPLDEPAKTLKAGVHGVPGGENMLRMPDGSVRYFTVRESARLQTFPDEMIFHGAWGETMRQLGNAVPSRLAEVVLRSVRSKLTRTSSRDHTSA